MRENAHKAATPDNNNGPDSLMLQKSFPHTHASSTLLWIHGDSTKFKCQNIQAREI